MAQRDSSAMDVRTCERHSMHSAKATILSWMSKANIEIFLRRLADYHVQPGDKSALNIRGMLLLLCFVRRQVRCSVTRVLFFA